MTLKDFAKIDLDKLKTNKKITILKFSDFGFPICIKINLEDLFMKNNNLQISGQLDGKIKSTIVSIKPCDNFVIYHGFVDRIVDCTNADHHILGICFDENSFLRSIDTFAEILLSSDNVQQITI